MSSPTKGQVLAGRYEIRELLGEGGMGRVYLALDLKSSEEVALKTVKRAPGTDGSILKRFHREIRTVQRLAHPDIIRYLDHGRDGEIDFLVVERVRGRTLGEASAEFLGVAPKVLLLGTRLARAFAAAHAQGVIHRDIKPGNILMTDSGEPRILDYGLARWDLTDGVEATAFSTVENLTEAEAILGTLPYMSPEQLRGERADRRSDIFSLGVLLYELAAGKRPYEGVSVAQLLSSLDRGVPALLGALRPELTSPAGEALDTVLRTVLRPRRDDRYQTMTEFAEALDRAQKREVMFPPGASTAILVPPRTAFARIWTRTLFGREAEMVRFDRTLASAAEGRGGIFVIEGPSGIGTSHLVAELVRRAHAQGWLCLPSSGVPSIDRPDERAEMRWLRRTAEVFPDDEALLGDSAATEGIFALLAPLADRIPLLILLEEAHFAEPALFEQIARHVGSFSSRRLLIVISFRSDVPLGDERAKALDRLLTSSGAGRLVLDPLDAAVLGRMAEERYPGASFQERFLDRWRMRVGGNPAYAGAILACLEEQGCLRRDGPDWIFEEPEEVPFPPGAAADLRKRLAPLDAGGLSLVEAAAVLGSSFEEAPLAIIAEVEPEALSACLQAIARSTRLVGPGPGGGWRFDQPVTRETLHETIETGRRADLHRRAARAMELRASMQEDLAATESIAFHYFAANEPASALPHAVLAGRLLFERSMPERAIPWLQRARAVVEEDLERAAAPEREALRAHLAEVHMLLGECCHLAARHVEALDCFENVRRFAAGGGRPDLQAQSLIWISRDLFAKGDFLQAQRRAREAQRIARQSALEVEIALAVAAEAQALSRAGEIDEAEEKFQQSASSLLAAGRHEQAAEVEFRLASLHLRLERYDLAESSYRRAEKRLEGGRNLRLLAMVKNGLAAVLLGKGRPAQALVRFESAASTLRAIGSRREEATSLHHIAYCLYLMGDLRRAEQLYLKVTELRGEIGDVTGRASSLLNHAEVLLDLGRIEQALAECSEAVAAKRHIEDLSNLPVFLNPLGRMELTLGRTERAKEILSEVVRDFPAMEAESLMASLGLAEAQWLAGDISAARQAFEELLERPKESLTTAERVSVQYSLLRFFEAQGESADRLLSIASGLPRSLEDEAVPETRLFHALVRALLARAEGRVDENRSALEEAFALSLELETPERSWRIRRRLAALEPEGSEAWRSELQRAAEIIRKQASLFRSEELRRAYLAHRERAELLVQAPPPALTGGTTVTV